MNKPTKDIVWDEDSNLPANFFSDESIKQLVDSLIEDSQLDTRKSNIEGMTNSSVAIAKELGCEPNLGAIASTLLPLLKKEWILDGINGAMTPSNLIDYTGGVVGEFHASFAKDPKYKDKDCISIGYIPDIELLWDSYRVDAFFTDDEDHHFVGWSIFVD